jgi:ribonuclease D
MERIALPETLHEQPSTYASFCRTGVAAWLIDDPVSADRVWQALADLQPLQLAVDFETTARSAADGRIRLVQLGVALGPRGGPVQWIFDSNSVDITPLTEWLENPAVEKLIQYAPFEQSWAWHHLGATITPVFDTCLAWRVVKQAISQLDETARMALATIYPDYHDHGAGLGELCQQLLWFPLPKEEQRSDWSQPMLRPAQLLYAALDVAVLPLLSERIRMLVRALGLETLVSQRIDAELARSRR